ncbi:conserved domain protein [Actinomyces sp. oral taxon 175 str. F0384]|nr:conserved domain protein [Actinomyces sp. oral taxon 175 str. F0384]
MEHRANRPDPVPDASRTSIPASTAERMPPAPRRRVGGNHWR